MQALRRSLAVFLSLLLASSCATAPVSKPAPAPAPTPAPTPAPKADTPPVAIPESGELPLWNRIRIGKLPNGLTYYVLPHKQPRNRAALWLAVNAGALQEDDDQQGLAHFTEHMAFNGTARFAKQGIVDFMEKSGMKFGPDVNAFTSFDETVYQLTVPTDDAKVLSTGLDVLRDWAGGISFEPDEVEKERGVVLEEWRLGKGAQDRLFKKQAPIVFGGTRYARRLPIGDPEIIKKAPREAATRFYADWYRPDLMAVIVVGDVDADAMIKEITARFSDLKNPAKERERITAGPLDQGGPKVSIETDPEMPRAVIQVQQLFPHRSESTVEDFGIFVREQLYHFMLGARLRDLSRKSTSPFVGAFTSTGNATRELEAFTALALAKDGMIEPALDALLSELARVERHGFTPAELERAKKALANGFDQSAAEWDKQEASAYASELTRHFFEHELVIGREGEAILGKRFLAKITLEEVNAVPRAYQGPLAYVISAPEKTKGLPSKERVLEIAASVQKRKLDPWVEAEAPKALITTPPTPGTIVKKDDIDDLGVTRWVLSNGVTVIVKPTDFENQTVQLTAMSPGGTALARDAVFPSARFAVAAVSPGGMGQWSDDQIDKYLAGKTATAGLMLGENSEGVSGRSSVADLETMLQLVYLQMTAPRRDEEAFAAWQLGLVAALENRDLTPDTALGDEMTITLSGGHKRRRPITAADVRKVNLDQALAFYKDRFGDASDFTFVITGNVDLAKLEPLVLTYLGSLPGKRGVEKWKDIGVKPPRGVVEKVVKKGLEPKAQVQIVYLADDKWSADAERDLAILTEVLRIRLREILREDMSGVYGVRIRGSLSRVPRQRRMITISFGCAPENVDALRKAVDTEIARLQKEGVDQSYLDKVKAEIVRSHETELRDNGYWGRVLLESAIYGDDPHDSVSTDKLLARISSDTVKQAALRFLPGKPRVTGILVPTAPPPASGAK